MKKDDACPRIRWAKDSMKKDDMKKDNMSKDKMKK